MEWEVESNLRTPEYTVRVYTTGLIRDLIIRSRPVILIFDELGRPDSLAAGQSLLSTAVPLPRGCCAVRASGIELSSKSPCGILSAVANLVNNILAWFKLSGVKL